MFVLLLLQNSQNADIMYSVQYNTTPFTIWCISYHTIHQTTHHTILYDVIQNTIIKTCLILFTKRHLIMSIFNIFYKNTDYFSGGFLRSSHINHNYSIIIYIVTMCTFTVHSCTPDSI